VINSCAHFPFGKSNNAFDTALKIKSFALSTAPLLSGWFTKANANLIPSLLQKVSKFRAIELHPIVDCDVGWYTKTANDSLPHEAN
jgi:hypothetical protein